jgi:transposase
MCAINGRTKASHEVRHFSTATRDLLELADWLAAQGITHVAMEATGIYWKPIGHILEGRFELVLANAAHIRNVPGRLKSCWDDFRRQSPNPVAIE